MLITEGHSCGLAMWFSGRASDWHSADTGSIPLVRHVIFSPKVNFQCRLSYGVRAPPCAIACIYICAHVKDPVVHDRISGLWKNKNTQCAP